MKFSFKSPQMKPFSLPGRGLYKSYSKYKKKSDNKNFQLKRREMFHQRQRERILRKSDNARLPKSYGDEIVNINEGFDIRKQLSKPIFSSRPSTSSKPLLSFSSKPHKANSKDYFEFMQNEPLL